MTKFPKPLLPGDRCRADGYAVSIYPQLVLTPDWGQGGPMLELHLTSSIPLNEIIPGRTHRYTFRGFWSTDGMVVDSFCLASEQGPNFMAPPRRDLWLSKAEFLRRHRMEKEIPAPTSPDMESQIYMTGGGFRKIDGKEIYYSETYALFWDHPTLAEYEIDQASLIPSAWSVIFGHEDDWFPVTLPKEWTT